MKLHPIQIVAIIFIGIILIYTIIKLIIKCYTNRKILKDLNNYRTFKTQEEVESWAEDRYGKLFLLKTKRCYKNGADDPYWIGYYKGKHSSYFNEHPYSPKSETLNNYLNSFTFEENFITYRYCDKKEYEGLTKWKPNHIDKFLSTTLLPELFNGYGVKKDYIYKILIPKGTKGLYLPNKSPNDLEFEILLPRNSNLIFIGNSTYNNQKIRTFIIEYL